MERFTGYPFNGDERGHERRARRFETHDPGREPRQHHKGPGRGPAIRHGERGFGGFGQPFGPGGPFGPGRGFGRRPMVRRGDVRSAILAVLADGPMHGYQVMQELRGRSGGYWAPSAGSIYPTLQQLEDEGLVQAQEADGRRVFTLTETGNAEAAKFSGASAPWNVERDASGGDPRQLIAQVAQAAVQVYQVGSPAALEEAQKILTGARRSLYQLLAADDADEGQTETSGAAPEEA